MTCNNVLNNQQNFYFCLKSCTFEMILHDLQLHYKTTYVFAPWLLFFGFRAIPGA